MKEINMYVRGSSDKSGCSCVVILEYKGTRKIMIYKNQEGTPQRLILLAFLNGIGSLKEPCKINAYTHASIGLKAKGVIKGAINSDLKEKLMQLINERGHFLNLTVGREMQGYMIDLLRKTKNYNQSIINLTEIIV